ncbi:MAG: hypothetical protein E7331_09810 [Clostridiales bacterium]|nr:hypothetical protein [Clostridiales bacterium]
MLKRSIISLIVILSTLLILTVPALALSGSGTSSDPYLVGSLADLKSVVESGNGGYIQLTANIPLTSKYTFPAKSFTIDGQGQYGFVASASTWATGGSTKHLVGINTSGQAVTFKNLTFDCGSVAQGVNVYVASNVTLDNVTINNCSTKTMSALTVNGSNVTVVNGLNIPGNLMMAIDVSKGSGVTQIPSFVLSGECTINGIIMGSGTGTVVSLSAGTYNKKPNAKYIATGYYARDNGDKTWTILPITYTVKFETEGGDAIEDASVPYGGTFSLPVPSRAGYNFVGWYLDDGFATPYEGGEISGDMVLYALWEEAPVESEPEPEPEQSAPVTGDTAPLGLWVLLIAISAGMIVALRKRSA